MISVGQTNLRESKFARLQALPADSQAGLQPLPAAGQPLPQQLQQQVSGAQQVPGMPPGFMQGMPPGMAFPGMPGMLPMPPMMPPGLGGNANGMPGFVAPPFTADMMQQMQQLPGMSAAMVAAGAPQAMPAISGAGAPGNAAMLHQQMMASAMQFWQYWAALNPQQQAAMQQQAVAAAGGQAVPMPQLQQQPDMQQAHQQQAQPEQQQTFQHQLQGGQGQLAPGVVHYQQAGTSAPGQQPRTGSGQAALMSMSYAPPDVTMAEADTTFSGQMAAAQAAFCSGGGGSGGLSASGMVPQMAGVSVSPAVAPHACPVPLPPAVRNVAAQRTNSGALAVAMELARRSSSNGGSGEPPVPLPMGACASQRLLICNATAGVPDASQ